MPLYDYACSSCGNCFEDVNTMDKSNELVKCPACGNKAKRILSPTQNVCRLNLKISQKKQRRRIM